MPLDLLPGADGGLFIAGATVVLTDGSLTTAKLGALVLPRVTLVDTVTANTDMRGTDSAALASVWTPTIAGRIDAAISSRMATFTYTAPDNATLTKLLSTLELISGSTYRFTTGALALAPSGGGGGGGFTTDDRTLLQAATRKKL
jgi:hypothetical protein